VQEENGNKREKRNWYVLNCHLQAGKQAPRRVRQINEGVRSVMTLARKQKGTVWLLSPPVALSSLPHFTDNFTIILFWFSRRKRP
jgi:hypothetical protein